MISLVDTAVVDGIEAPRPAAPDALFERHAGAGLVRAAPAVRTGSGTGVVVPSPDDQELVHRELIYPVKTGADARRLARPARGPAGPVPGRDVRGWAVTELHVLAKRYAEAGGAGGCVDPLATVARNWSCSP